MKTATQILSRVYRLSDVCDANDAHIAIGILLDNLGQLNMADYPSVVTRFLGLKKLVEKYESEMPTAAVTEFKIGQQVEIMAGPAAGRITTIESTRPGKFGGLVYRLAGEGLSYAFATLKAIETPAAEEVKPAPLGLQFEPGYNAAGEITEVSIVPAGLKGIEFSPELQAQIDAVLKETQSTFYTNAAKPFSVEGEILHHVRGSKAYFIALYNQYGTIPEGELPLAMTLAEVCRECGLPLPIEMESDEKIQGTVQHAPAPVPFFSNGRWEAKPSGPVRPSLTLFGLRGQYSAQPETLNLRGLPMHLNDAMPEAIVAVQTQRQVIEAGNGITVAQTKVNERERQANRAKLPDGHAARRALELMRLELGNMRRAAQDLKALSVMRDAEYLGALARVGGPFPDDWNLYIQRLRQAGALDQSGNFIQPDIKAAYMAKVA